MKTKLREYGHRKDSEYPYSDHLHVDVIIVGAGFSGVYLLHELRKLGFKAVIYEAGTGLGGTWRWNCYPGARVDSEVPMYEYSIPEVWKDWTWSTNYPGQEELCRYFDHVDKVLGISKDCAFESVVVDAQFREAEGKWHVKTEDGRTARSKYLIVAAGFSAKRYIPDFKGFTSFEGIVHHSSFWPEEGVDVRGKRCAVIGTGASGVQIIQEWGPQVGSLKVFQRTPNLAIPMGKIPLTQEEQQNAKVHYPQIFELRDKYFSGFTYGFSEKNTFDDTSEEREASYQKLWDRKGFRFWMGAYKDMLFDASANKQAYNFWAKNVRNRIDDPRKRDLLAPLEAPHYFGVKRPCLEQNYYEQFNRPNVDIVNINETPIAEFVPSGILMGDGTLHELDVIVIATGFDVSTGGLTQMGMRNTTGQSLEDEWKSAASTYLGLTISGYPNLFNLYGLHGPTLLANGPTCAELQGRWVVDAIMKMEREGLKYIEPTPEASKEWKKKIIEFSDATLFPTTKSTYMGGSLPGKAFEPVSFTGGIPAYAEEIQDALPQWKGFKIVKYNSE